METSCVYARKFVHCVQSQCAFCKAGYDADKPRHPLPTVITQNYVLRGELSETNGAWIVWFIDGMLAV